MAKVPRDLLVMTIVVLASSFSFGLGYLAGTDAGQGSRLAVEALPAPLTPVDPETAVDAGGQVVVASKNGTKYYLPTCAGASRIAPANKVWFASVAAAVAAGYTPAANCKGL